VRIRATALRPLLEALAFLGVLAGGLFAAEQAHATTLRPLDLHVAGGEERWRVDPRFTLYWELPPGPVAAIHYRLLDPSGRVAIGKTTLDRRATSIERLKVPPAPGVYTAEVWLEAGDGTQGPPVDARLRFDDVPPGSVEPPPVDGWIGRTVFPFAVRLGRPTGPPPLSGVRGYAVSVGANPHAKPCVAAVCTEAEIDLRGGGADDTFALGELPEGTSYLHAVAVSGAGLASERIGGIVLRIDKTEPVTRLGGVPEGWSSRPVTLRAEATDSASGMEASGAGGPFTAIRVDGGAPFSAAGNSVEATLIASGVHTIAHYARDAAGNVADGGLSNGQPNRAPAVATVRIDREPPGISFAPAQDPFDPERIEARAGDPLAGVDPARGSIAVRRAGSGEPFAALPTARSGERLRARWDSFAYPPGEYEFRAVAFDLAGNAAVTTSRADGAPMRLSAPLKVSTKLLTETPARAAPLPYGRQARFAGRLLAGRRAPLAGRPVKVIERFAPGAVPRQRVRTVLTGADGAFAVELAAGASRQVLAVTAPTETTGGASSQPVDLPVRGRLKMSASAASARVGGAPLVFRGRVANGGATIPTEGKVVQLQFRLAGLPWREFRTIRTDRRGRFRYAYRFADDDSRGMRFQFRAFAPAQAGWPFEPAGSAPVAVRGR
jgi:hypothetical protein